MIGIFIWTMIFLFTGVFIGYAIGSYLEMQKREEPRTKELKSLEVEKMSEKQSNLTDKEMEDLQDIVTDTLASVCAMADKHNIDRDSMLKYFADMLTGFTEVASIQNCETNRTCNCQHNSNSRDNEPCCRCDSNPTNAEIVKVDSLEIIVRMIGNKPYYEIKYKKVGEYYYHIGYSSFNIDNVLKCILNWLQSEAE